MKEKTSIVVLQLISWAFISILFGTRITMKSFQKYKGLKSQFVFVRIWVKIQVLKLYCHSKTRIENECSMQIQNFYCEFNFFDSWWWSYHQSRLVSKLFCFKPHNNYRKKVLYIFLNTKIKHDQLQSSILVFEFLLLGL